MKTTMLLVLCLLATVAVAPAVSAGEIRVYWSDGYVICEWDKQASVSVFPPDADASAHAKCGTTAECTVSDDGVECKQIPP